MPDIIVAKQLSKRFGNISAVDGLSFSVPEGKIYGFLGQNGAGKSTTIRMLLTLITPTSGEIEIFGLDLRKHRRKILRKVGAIIERPDSYNYLSAIENLEIFAGMSGVRLREKELLEHLDRVGLAGRSTNKVKTFSQGMKQRLGLALALINDPELLILDEPMNGLDPQGIADMRNLILHLSREMKKTLLISSHLLSEMEVIADSMLIIDKGRKVVEGTMTDLFNPAETIVDLQTNNIESVYQHLEQTDIKKYLFEKTVDSISFRLPRNEIPALIKRLVQLEVEIISLSSKHSLEHYFLSLTTENQHVEAFRN